MSVSTFFRRHTAAWLGSPAGRYTAGEVRRLLDPKAEGADQERRRAVLATASLPGAWTERLDPREAWSLGRLAGRLPTVVGFYASGLSLDEIRERIGTWSAWEVGRALDAACVCIAERLNDRHLPAVRGASNGPRGTRI